MGLERFVAAVLAATGLAVFVHFEEKAPPWRRLSKRVYYFGVRAALSRRTGRPWTLVPN